MNLKNQRLNQFIHRTLPSKTELLLGLMIRVLTLSLTQADHDNTAVY